MASEIKAKVTAGNYPQVRAICGGGMREKFESWEYEQQRASHGTIDMNPQPPTVVDIDLDELRAFVQRTGQRGDTAIHNYAADKAAQHA